ncbi:hypothetical protein [Streptomyces flavofungini]|uniref:Uncharacterized protein n=1 Tax=Streptomyces flavofungini TaxID=68200 RepID=A0ABS0XHC4_9ACTN|nr:hypothetical protein [Streptomyces flavofungini]MBJ3812603.1 hypothetical protein [Streptomyces flavofungini]
MWSRARLAWCPLVGVLVVVLGLGVLCGSAGAAGSGAGARAGAFGYAVDARAGAADALAGAPEGQVAAAAGQVFAAGVQALAEEGHGVPGCGRGGEKGDGQRPAAPPRSPSSYELLPALYDTRAAAVAWICDPAVLTVSPGRAPPALVPPSPMDLSVLRV